MKYTHGVLSLIVFSIFFTSPPSMAAKWNIQQITDDNNYDSEPVINNTHLAWLSWVDGKREVLAYDGEIVNRLTNNDLSEQNLFASDKYIAWNWRDGANGDDIFLYDGTSVTQITDTSTDQFGPVVSGEKMVWTRSVNDVILYDITSGTPSHLNGTPGSNGNELNPWIHGNTVTFQSNQGSSGNKLFYYNITADTYHDVDTTNGQSKVNHGYIAYGKYDGDTEVKVYDRTKDETRNPTSNSHNDGNIMLDGKYVVWTSDSGASSDDSLYILDASDAANTPVLIDENISSYEAASMHGNLVVYSGWDGNDWEIFIYEIDSAKNTQLTDNDDHDRSPVVWGNRIAWVRSDNPAMGPGTEEIMLATPAEDIYYVIKPQNGKVVVLPFD